MAADPPRDDPRSRGRDSGVAAICGYDAVVLAGGRGSRLGGVAKPGLTIDGRRLLDIALDAVAGARRRVVVGDVEVPVGVLVTLEDPPFSGPVAGVAAGMDFLGGHAPWTVLLAGDLPNAEPGMRRLLAARPGPGVDGLCLLENGERLQWLFGVYRTESLLDRLADRGDPPVTAMYRLLEPLCLQGVAATDAEVADVDTPADAQRWNVALSEDGRRAR
jgi:molybdopterin-guanine dinucleotide biosynthesis protein A